MERLVTHDPIGGRRVVLHEDMATGQIVQETTQDITALIERNKALYAAGDKRTTFKNVDGLRWAASMPHVLWQELWDKGIVQDENAFLRWLDQPENQYFRVAPGTLARR